VQISQASVEENLVVDLTLIFMVLLISLRRNSEYSVELKKLQSGYFYFKTVSILWGYKWNVAMLE